MQRHSRRFASATAFARACAAVLLIVTAPPAAGRVASEPFESPSANPDLRAGFTRLSPEESGFTEINRYRDPRAWNERYVAATAGSVGTGIGVGDFNGNGWPDVFIAMREGQNRLYLNDRGKHFVDATEVAGIPDSPDWTTGVTVVDINGNGHLDIYVCYFDAPNRLYVNRGNAVFDEKAAEFGLDVRDASNAAFFADMNGNGRLDLYLQTNVLHEQHGGDGQPDYLFRNDGETGFTDITEAAGIRFDREGATHGHSVLWFDFNGNGMEDLYVANDFATHDFLYLNRGDDTFEEAAYKLPAVPYSSMGSDIGDVNGNGRLDLLTTDMATPSYVKHVESMITNARKTYWLRPGSRPPMLMKNALLLNRGPEDFIDVAYAWNLAATDWTWTARLVDLDNSGWLDAAFTNGMIRQFHNVDLSYKQDQMTSVTARNAVFRESPVLRENNLLFRNVDGVGFEPANEPWGFQHVGVSFAAVFFDFDRDGDLDILYTNFEEPPTLWRNDLDTGNAVQIRLQGKSPNTEAVGAVVTAHFGERAQAQKILSNRGYLSSDDKTLHFGLGNAPQIDRLEIRWPDGSVQVEKDLPAGMRHTVTQADPEDASPAPALTLPDRAQDKDRRLQSPTEPKRAHAAWANEVASPRPSSRFVVRPGPPEEISPSPPTPLPEPDLHYPFKPIPRGARQRLFRADFNGDGAADTLFVQPWTAPRLIASGTDVSGDWGLTELRGVWESVLVADLTGNGFPDVILGGLGINHEISYRGRGDGRMIRHTGRFGPRNRPLNLNLYDWNGTLRLFDGLIDFSEIDPRLPSFFYTFRETGTITGDEFIDRTGFQIDQTFEIDRFRSGVLVNRNGEGFDFVPLPREAQYGRVWDIAAGDLNGNGITDLVLLLGHLSPHPRSAQDESSFLSVFIGQGDGTFAPEARPVLDSPIHERITAIHLERSKDNATLDLLLDTEKHRRFRYRVNP